MPLLITDEQKRAIEAHGVRDYPHECCGFLVGKNGADGVRVAQVVPVANDWDQIERTDENRPGAHESTRNRFEIDPLMLLQAEKAARAEGLGVVGFYHSHPDVAARPSEYDREHAWPGYCYVIVSIVRAEPREMNNWLLREDRSGYESDPIVVQ